MRITRFVLSLALVGGTLSLVACDDSREIKREESTDVRKDGTVEKKTEVERQNDDGTITKEETSKEVER